jgi:phage-related protein
MAVWIWVESPGTGLSEEPSVSRTKYGDGYEERAPSGLNPIKQVWTYQARGVDNAIADEMVAFLRARLNLLGMEAFDYTPLWANPADPPIKVVCPSWTRTQGEEWGMSDISARFEQVFEP